MMIDFKHLAYSIMQKIIEIRYNCSESFGEILMFHQVNNNKNEWDYPSCSITLDAFEKFIEDLIKQKCVFKPITDILVNRGANDRYITFDDAYRDIFIYAIPILIKYHIPFAVFITLDYLGLPKYLNTNMLKELTKTPLCTVGSHSISHPALRELNMVTSKREIMESGKILSEIIGRPVEFFAYPYGSLYACSKININQTASSGYKLAFSTLNSGLTKNSLGNIWFLPRININEKNYRSYLQGAKPCRQ